MLQLASAWHLRDAYDESKKDWIVIFDFALVYGSIQFKKFEKSTLAPDVQSVF